MHSKNYEQPLSPAELVDLFVYLETEAPFLASELLMLIEQGKLRKVPTHCRLLYRDMLRRQAGSAPGRGYIAQLVRMQAQAPHHGFRDGLEDLRPVDGLAT